MVLLYSLLWIFLCVILQTLLFNHLPLFGGVVLVYLIALIKMPVEINRNVQILVGFIIGLIIDIFCNTIGLHALTAVTIMWIRMPILHLYVNADDVKTGTPSASLIGMQPYIRYALTMLALHCFLLYFIESFTLFNFVFTLLKTFMSIVMTFFVFVSLELATLQK